jgi:hypothetical protein
MADLKLGTLLVRFAERVGPLADAAQTIMDEGELDVAMPRIEAMRQYAATVA